ncbi:hypothetical protein EJ077_03560 [Mesorhizobium sp. M8A.F.Ca.ET.057.01.1.1]|uniref:hypothetical protein n=1 Tax=Mesorhizobium sp. M8A.F.Ca.ET.057.01.1.1 TaxID=2493679 RepID=UPI000F75ECA6|nr:hypothetical protein [Mesorhizobium sp. M8A.F.Ca.ET.057.01.1.1]AZO52676.1 hypothetical protein EJ077_03560 [Mesorhizobium sp. M8A.F.Ca.ET.057.01.1.1]
MRKLILASALAFVTTAAVSSPTQAQFLFPPFFGGTMVATMVEGSPSATATITAEITTVARITTCNIARITDITTDITTDTTTIIGTTTDITTTIGTTTTTGTIIGSPLRSIGGETVSHSRIIFDAYSMHRRACQLGA